MLTTYDWIFGSAEFAAAFLGIVAGLIAISMLRHSRSQRHLRAWRWLIIAVVIFAVEEVVGALKTFGIYSTPHLTHIIPFFILLFLIAGLVTQINITRGWME